MWYTYYIERGKSPKQKIKKKVTIMKANNTVKKTRIVLIIMAVITLLTAAGVVVNFVQTGMWSCGGCMAASLCAILCSAALEGKKKAKKSNI